MLLGKLEGDCKQSYSYGTRQATPFTRLAAYDTRLARVHIGTRLAAFDTRLARVHIGTRQAASGTRLAAFDTRLARVHIGTRHAWAIGGEC